VFTNEQALAGPLRFGKKVFQKDPKFFQIRKISNLDSHKKIGVGKKIFEVQFFFCKKNPTEKKIVFSKW